MLSDNALIVFLKYPEPGKVKTRLAKDIGPDEACTVYKELVEKTLGNTYSQAFDRFIFFSPSGKEKEIKYWLGEEFTYFSQKGDDLGTKMCNAFEKAFELGYEKTVIIGTDIPNINCELLAEAFDSLLENDIVIGPSKDGGYYLVGMKKLLNDIFEEIDWSTSKVFFQTEEKLRGSGKKVKVLEELIDIDTFDDLKNINII